MKLIHLADVHLDSKLQTHLDKRRAKERRAEILHTFCRVVSYAKKEAVRGILIAGDFFDTEVVSRETGKIVYEEMKNHPEITFFYLRGNHDRMGFFQKFEELPSNLKIFDEKWTKYEYPLLNGKKVVIAGVELTKENVSEIYENLSLEEQNFNIVMLHGELTEYKKKERAETIEIKRLSYQNIDYLALGHIHEHRIGDLPPCGKYAYAGCLEGRGFDELGEHGVVLLDIDEEELSFQTTFLPFAKRRIFELPFVLSERGYVSDLAEQIIEKARNEGIRREDLVKVILQGEIDLHEERGIDPLLQALEDSFYFIKIYDRTKTKIHYLDYLHDRTLKGEFIRLLQDSEEEEKEEIIRCGIRALQGEEFER